MVRYTALNSAAVRAALHALRPAALAGELAAEALAPEAIAQRVQEQLRARLEPRLKAVFNLTGTVLHTNLGRALLPDRVMLLTNGACIAPSGSDTVTCAVSAPLEKASVHGLNSAGSLGR